MPYIKQSHKNKFRIEGDIENPGELNYLFTLLITQYITYNGLSYQTINDIVGALEGSKLEFVRQVVNKYEDKKIIENGGIYD